MIAFCEQRILKTKLNSATVQPNTLFLTAQSSQFFLCCVRKSTYSQIVVIILRILSSDKMVHFIDQKKTLTYVDFDCSFTLCIEAPLKVVHINQTYKGYSRYSENPKCIRSSVQHYCSPDKEHTSNVFLDPKNLCDMGSTALLTLNNTPATYE